MRKNLTINVLKGEQNQLLMSHLVVYKNILFMRDYFSEIIEF